MDGITLDGRFYHVRVVFDSLKRSFELLSGPNAGDMISGRKERDLLGTAYSYRMQIQPDPRYPKDYDDFYQAISAPVDSHSITLPYGQTTITYDAEVESGEDVFHGKCGGVQRWRELTVHFDYIKPQRMVEA